MRKILFVCLLSTSLLGAEPLDKRDREFGMSQLHATRKMFLDSVAGLSPEQWNYKPAPDRWSIAECAEHIALSEDMIFGMVTEKIMKTPATPEKRSETKGKDEQVLKGTVDRSQKAQAPESLRPTHRWKTPAEAVEAFKKSRDAHILYIEKTNDELRDHFAPSPVGGTFDAYQYLLMMSAHTERHTKQIQEVKASPGFPRG